MKRAERLMKDSKRYSEAKGAGEASAAKASEGAERAKDEASGALIRC